MQGQNEIHKHKKADMDVYEEEDGVEGSGSGL
jgi:hypothetical protein